MRSKEILEPLVGNTSQFLLTRTGRKLAPKIAKRPREVSRPFLQPALQVPQINPLSFTDLKWVEIEGSLGPALVDPDEFIPGLLAGRFFKNGLHRLGGVEADFLSELTVRGRVVILTGINVAGTRAHPFPRSGVFCHRPPLQVELPAVVKNKNVDRAMVQLFSVYC